MQLGIRLRQNICESAILVARIRHAATVTMNDGGN
jgi:hypothetical protein